MPIIDIEDWDERRVASDPRIAVYAPSADDARLRDHADEALLDARRAGSAGAPLGSIADPAASGASLDPAIGERGLFIAESSKVALRALLPEREEGYITLSCTTAGGSTSLRIEVLVLGTLNCSFPFTS